MSTFTHGSTRYGTVKVDSTLKGMVSTGASPVGFFFGDLAAEPANRLPEGEATIRALESLGASMGTDPSSAESGIPAAYTYFGQFIDHDITKTVTDRSLSPPDGKDPIEVRGFSPIPFNKLADSIGNERSMTLDLDSLYEGPAAATKLADGRMRLSDVSRVSPEIATERLDHDLPRDGAERMAVIGDPRNDENLLVAQLHTAFLRTHNALVGRLGSFEAARSALRRRYQWAVLHDFLRRVSDPVVWQDVMTNGPSVWKPGSSSGMFMPVEFSAAAYRFGHSMIRAVYNHNDIFRNASFDQFFRFTALSGNMVGLPSLPSNWITEWANFFGSSSNQASLNPARRIDTRLTPELSRLPDINGTPMTTLMGKLASRNLLRGFLFGLPTGQAVANRLGVTRRPDLRGLPQPLDAATPLWYYILAEAEDPNGPNGMHLGEVGSRIVCETLWNAVRFSADSVIESPPSEAEVASGEFTLKGIVGISLDRRLKQFT
jgi:hypothetical protein